MCADAPSCLLFGTVSSERQYKKGGLPTVKFSCETKYKGLANNPTFKGYITIEDISYDTVCVGVI